MSTLKKPKFKKLSYSSFGGAPLLLSLWNRFDLSLLLTQSGIFKSRGVPTRFMVSKFQWNTFNLRRISKFQETEETKLEEDDVIALDDTLVAHNYAEKIPFIYRLWDHCNKIYIEAMNLVVLHAVKMNGLQYPLLYFHLAAG